MPVCAWWVFGGADAARPGRMSQFRIQVADGDSFDEEDLQKNPELAEMMAGIDTCYWGNSLFQLTRREQAEDTQL